MNVQDLFSLAAVLAVILGGGVLLFVYVIVQMKGKSASAAPQTQQQQQRSDKRKCQDKFKSTKQQQQQQVKNRKLDSRHTQGHQQQSKQETFSHPWLLATLKGHTGEILHMDFASNGKYLSSCADEDPDPGGRRRRRRRQSQSTANSSSADTLTSSSSSSETGSDAIAVTQLSSATETNSSSSGSEFDSPRSVKGLSRRQRKNYRKHELSTLQQSTIINNNNNKKSTIAVVSSNKHSREMSNSSKRTLNLNSSHAQLPFSGYRALVADSGGGSNGERIVVQQLCSYLLPMHILKAMGYPVIEGDTNRSANAAGKCDCHIVKPNLTVNNQQNEKNSKNQQNCQILTDKKILRDRQILTANNQIVTKQQNGNRQYLAPPMAMTRYVYNSNVKFLPPPPPPPPARCCYYQFYGNCGYYVLPAPPMPVLTRYNVRAREFVPELTSSGGSSDESDTSSSPQPSSSDDSDDDDNPDEVYLRRKCARCAAHYITTRSEYVTRDACTYHWGKCVRRAPLDSYSYTCCNMRRGAKGCTTAPLHVSNTSFPHADYADFRAATRHAPAFTNTNIYALDCEMCYTVAGLECTKVTLVNLDGYVIYDSFVRPLNRIIDYNTRYSGIHEGDLANAPSLADVQDDLLGIIDNRTILIGHGLENDLKALKLVHYAIVDTAICFLDGASRRSLKNLMWTFLGRDVQNSPDGHDSYEDAVSCLELMCYRIRKDLKMAAAAIKAKV